MFKKLLVSGLFAGFAAGLIAALLQITLVVPTILEAELYESGALSHFGAPESALAHHDGQTDEQPSHVHDDSHAHDDVPAWTRHSLTILASVSTFIGYAMIMVAGFAMAARQGIAVSARSGMIWGIGGFLAVSLAPALGHAPELPGSLSAALEARQIWWVGTVAASLAGIALIAFGKNWSLWGLGIVLIALPHIIGAPHIAGYGGVVPPELAAQFVGLSLGVAAMGWVVLGLFAGFFWARESK